MSIKQHGGIFGRNPKFNNVDVAGTLTVDGSFVVNGSSMAPIYKGTWNANTNSPTLTSSVGVQGNFYIVSTAGTTTLNGISTWNVGDWALYNGVAWQKVEGGTSGNFATLTVTGAGEFGDGAVITPSITNIGDVDTGLYFPADNTLGITTAGTERMRVTSTNTVEFTANAEFADGLAASPSITNIGDNNTGLYFPSADAIGIVTGGVNRIRVTSTGNVGVGTTGPSVKLETADASNGATLELLRLSNTGTGANTKSRLNFYAASTNYGAITGGYGASAPEMVFDINTTAGAYIWNNNATEQMRIDSSGNVGIGTSSPSYKLDVAASAARIRSTSAYSGLLLSSGDPNASTRNWLVASNWNAYGDFALVQSNAQGGDPVSAGTTRLTVDASGNVGVGATSVTAIYGRTLQIGSGTSEASTSLVGSTGSVYFATVGATGQLIARGGMALVLGTNDVERARITAAGNVGIGAIPTGYGKLEVYQSANNRILFSGAAAYGNNAIAGINDVGAEVSMGIAGSPVAFYTNATERMRITSTGDVGIGTSSPAASLDVRGASGGILGQFLENSSGNNRRIRFSISSNVSNIESTASTGSTNLAFAVDGTERMRITSAGDVGIATTSPDAKLRVNGTAKIGEGAASNTSKLMVNTVSGVAAGIQLFQDANESWIIQNPASTTALTFANSGTERMRITSTGDVGIGTSSPSYKLDIRGSAVGSNFAAISVDNTAAGSGSPANTVSINFSNGGAVKDSITGAIYGDGYLAFATNNNTEKMRITAAGDVGIGTSSPGAKLDVAGAARVQGDFFVYGTGDRFNVFPQTAGSGVNVVSTNNANSAYAQLAFDGVPLIFRVAGTERMRLDSSGNLGIGTSSPGYRLTVAGTSGSAVVSLLETGVRSWGIRAGGVTTNTFDIADFTAGVSRLTLDASGNLGLGVTPSAWISAYRALDIGNTASVYGRTDSSIEAALVANAYRNSAANWIYKLTGIAGRFGYDTVGSWAWYNAPSGTAGNVISFTQAMTLDASGDFIVGGTTTNSIRLTAEKSNPTRGIIAHVINSGSSGLTGSQLMFTQNTVNNWVVGQPAGVDAFAFWSGRNTAADGTERLRITSAGNIHTPAGATTMTNGFFYIPAAAGVPTGVPTAITGTVPMYYDTTNNKFYVYNGAWKSVTLT